MKKSLLFPVLILVFNFSFSQKPIEPCCNVVGINPATGIILARNITTGQLFSFKPDALDLRSLRLNDAITTNEDFSMVTSMNGAVRKYLAEPVGLKFENTQDGKFKNINQTIGKNINKAEPVGKPQVDNAEPVGVIRTWGEPCCGIVDIQVNSAQPCCSMVTAKNKLTGATIRFKANAEVAKTVEIGDPVYAEPVGAYAIIQSDYNADGDDMNSFAYPIESGENNAENENTKWEIIPANMKGVLGRLDMNFPEGVEWRIDTRTTANKFITNHSVSGRQKHYDLSPGTYFFQLNTITVENVPVEKGKTTRLKAGYLNIVSEGSWNIYDDTKKKFYTSGNVPKMLALPVGSYQLKLGGQFYPVLIKDKKTVEY